MAENTEQQQPGQGLGEMLEQTTASHAEAHTVPRTGGQELPMAGMMETLLPKKPAPAPAPVSAAQGGTLDNNARLHAPTPIDIDPPPLQDVKPLSEPVTVHAPASSAQPKPSPAPTPAASAAAPSQSTIVGVVPAPDSQPEPVQIPAMATPAPEPVQPKIPDVDDMPDARIDSEPTRPVVAMPSEQEPVTTPETAETESFPTLNLSALTEAKAEPEIIEDDLTLEPEPIEEFEPEPVSDDEATPLMEVPGDDIESPESPEELPSLLLDSEPEEPDTDQPMVEEPVAELEDIPEEEAEEKKEVFKQEVLAPAPEAVAKGSGENPKAEGYVKNEFFVSEGAEDPWILPAAATAGLSSNQKKRRALGKLDIGIWSTFTTVFFFLALLVLGGAGIAWTMRGAIGDKIEARLAKKVEDAGYFVSYNGWSYDPVRGLVLEGVTVFENAEKVIPYAKIDNVGLNTDVLTLWKTKDPLSLKKTVSFRDSHLVLYDQGAEVANFQKLKGSLVLDRNQIGLEDLKGQIEGALFEVEGDVLLRSDSSAISLWYSKPSSEATSDGILLAQNDSIILKDSDPASLVEEEAPKPMFAPRTDILIPNPEPGPVTEKKPATAPVPEIVTEPVGDEEPVTEIVAESPVIDEVPTLPVDETESSTVPSIIEIPPADMVSSEPGFPQPPTAAISRGDDGELPSLAFLGDFTRFFKIRSGDNLPLVTSQVKVDLSNGDEPKVKATGRLTGDSITLDETAVAGITFNGVDVPYSYDHETGILDLPGFTAGHRDGRIAGDAFYEVDQEILHLSEVRSDLDLVALLTEVNPDMKEAFQKIKFLDAPEIYITKGKVPIARPLGGEVDFSYEQWSGLVIQTENKKLSINEIRGDFKLASGALSTSRLNAKVLDGVIDAVGSLRLTDPVYPFNGSIKARGIPMESIGEYAGINNEYMSGTLNLDYQGIVAKEINRMGGNGRVDLQNSQLYKVPVIGPIQRLLGAAIPVFNDRNTSAVFGHFIIESGVLMTSDLLVRSDGTKVAVKGQADLSRQLTAFSAKASLDGPLGIATGLIEEQIQVEGRGPLHSPQISLKGGALPAGFSDENIKNMLGMTDGTAEALTAMMQEIAAGSGGLGGVINGVGGVRTSTGQTGNSVDSAASLIDGLKKRDANSISNGIQGLLGRGQ
ncbi:MAG: AsmA-like C-terminal region-containing protein [Verrucomicrobiales bacterium]|nr:AsmA-like C-terminal region-containing protein [Verrucomicrobiales bacterium]